MQVFWRHFQVLPYFWARGNLRNVEAILTTCGRENSSAQGREAPDLGPPHPTHQSNFIVVYLSQGKCVYFRKLKPLLNSPQFSHFLVSERILGPIVNKTDKETEVLSKGSSLYSVIPRYTQRHPTADSPHSHTPPLTQPALHPSPQDCPAHSTSSKMNTPPYVPKDVPVRLSQGLSHAL